MIIYTTVLRYTTKHSVDIVFLFNVSYSELEAEHKRWLCQCHNRKQQVYY